MNSDLYRDELLDRIERIEVMLEATDLGSVSMGNGAPARVDASREARGVAVVLLYAAYEHLISTLTLDLAAEAKAAAIPNLALARGFKVFALVGSLKSVQGCRAVGPQHAFQVMDALADPLSSTIEATWFPDDGSHFRSSQVKSICSILGLSEPETILGRAWDRIDTIVDERNAIAHGRRRPDEVGRRFSKPDLERIVKEWRDGWLSFIAAVATAHAQPHFFTTE
jgi:RiboL-PSP-HEPN